MHPTALLALEDGSLFYGVAIGATGSTVGEVIFNTAMAGYQEILTDPLYRGQMVALTYPHVGNTGTNPIDDESDHMQANGLIARAVPRSPSNWRNEASLTQYLEDNNVVAIAEVDTRRLTRLLRDKGALRGCIMAGDVDPKAAVQQAQNSPDRRAGDLACEVATKKAHEWIESCWHVASDSSRPAEPFCHLAVYDYGVRRSLLRTLVEKGARVTVVPPDTPVDDVAAMAVDGVVLSSGPGNPAACKLGVATAQALLDQSLPVFATGLGHQLLGLALGGRCTRLTQGRYGANHPVADTQTGQVMITVQAYGFAVDESTLPAHARVTHRSLFDNTVQGLEVADKPIFSFQGHPEGGDAARLLTRFLNTVESHQSDSGAHAGV